MQRKTHTIDAANKVLGRLSSEIAILLRGKQKPNFVPYKDMGDFVLVKNVDKIRLTGKKVEKKKHFRHTGYLGGLKATSMEKLFKDKPSEVLRKAVLGMLPKNRLRSEQIKRLKFK